MDDPDTAIALYGPPPHERRSFFQPAQDSFTEHMRAAGWRLRRERTIHTLEYVYRQLDYRQLAGQPATDGVFHQSAPATVERPERPPSRDGDLVATPLGVEGRVRLGPIQCAGRPGLLVGLEYTLSPPSLWPVWTAILLQARPDGRLAPLHQTRTSIKRPLILSMSEETRQPSPAILTRSEAIDLPAAGQRIVEWLVDLDALAARHGPAEHELWVVTGSSACRPGLILIRALLGG